MLVTPNLFVVGAPKCGTTTLYNHLNQHPEICMSSVKEPAFFDKDHLFNTDGTGNKEDWNDYLSLFNDCDGEQIKYLGDATPMMVFPETPRRIIQMCGTDVKIIISLRNPVDRAYSHYWHGYRLGLERGRPDDELFHIEEPDNVHDTGRFPKHYLLTGRYWLHIERFVNAFGNHNVLLLDFDELHLDVNKVMAKVWTFLGVEQLSVQSRHNNKATAPIFPRLQRFVAGDSWMKGALKLLIPSAIRLRASSYVISNNLRQFQYPPMSLELREKLIEYYSDDNNVLAQKYGFDISGWYEKD